MTGDPTPIGPFKKGLNNAAGIGEFIEDTELFQMVNLEVDVDGSIVNRPPIKRINVSGGTGDQYILGVFKDVTYKNYILNLTNVQADGSGTMSLYDPVTGGKMSSASPPMNSVAAIQWRDRMWVISRIAGQSGYWTYDGTNWAWTTVPAIPQGETVAVYRDRLIIGSGATSTSNTSRLWISNNGDGTKWDWGATPFYEIEQGNGEKVTCIISMANDMLVFKNHSTFRVGWATDPLQGEVSKISSTIGVPNQSCATTYDNNNVYLMHADNVYELFNYSFTEISQKIKLSQELDNTLRASELYAVSSFRDRLFVRYYKWLYVYNIKNQTWSEWQSARKFSKIVWLPTSGVSPDYAYAHPADAGAAVSLYYFQEDRIAGVGATGSLGEQYNCSLTTKTYDFDAPYKFKKQFYWSAIVASSGATTFSAVIPNAKQNMTWDYAETHYLWQDGVNIPILWSGAGDITISEVVQPTLGKYFRKNIKLDQSCRFRQIYYTISTVAVTNTTADASVRIFNIVTYLNLKEFISKKVS